MQISDQDKVQFGSQYRDQEESSDRGSKIKSVFDRLVEPMFHREKQALATFSTPALDDSVPKAHHLEDGEYGGDANIGPKTIYESLDPPFHHEAQQLSRDRFVM
ncbi:unnamed protein product [Arabis nemorensis]|uniref:Uncharacterized protein n=1 Tax=Arabis nemorensis TaxID=586526 RepID=A0A565BBU4_9BRAS|nr:unnamed protein product [Arabis nemorensis]